MKMGDVRLVSLFPAGIRMAMPAAEEGAGVPASSGAL
jgi:hypothetical protein